MKTPEEMIPNNKPSGSSAKKHASVAISPDSHRLTVKYLRPPEK